jgi:hypothetical protein
MNKVRFYLPIAMALLAHAGACSYPTRIQVENRGSTATKITVRSADGEFRVDFPELKPGEVSAEVDYEGASRSGVNVDASDNHENGIVDLEPATLNVIEIHEDGTEPSVRVVED